MFAMPYCGNIMENEMMDPAIVALRAIRDYDGDMDGVEWETTYGDLFDIDHSIRMHPMSQIAEQALDENGDDS